MKEGKKERKRVQRTKEWNMAEQSLWAVIVLTIRSRIVRVGREARTR